MMLFMMQDVKEFMMKFDVVNSLHELNLIQVLIT